MLASTNLSDADLLKRLVSRVSHERCSTAEVLSDLGEVDARKLYLPAGYTSMCAYCIEELRYSESSALKRIQAARLAREFPRVLAAVADGRLHLTAVGLLAPHLTPGNLDELIAAATHKGTAEIATLLRQRFAPPVLQMFAATPSSPGPEHSLKNAATEADERRLSAQITVAPPVASAPLVAPDDDWVTLPVRFRRSKLAYAQALVSHKLPSGDVSVVMDRALDTLICKEEKQKFAATDKPGWARNSGRNKRCVPAHVRRDVWKRDEGRCTFVGDSGHRCGATKFLEFDHVRPVARGGEATVDGMRLRCRAHNQYEAERVFGAEFMRKKREGARRAHNVTRFRDDVITGLRALGIGVTEAKRVVERVGTFQTLEETMHAALKLLGPRNGRMLLSRT